MCLRWCGVLRGSWCSGGMKVNSSLGGRYCVLICAFMWGILGVFMRQLYVVFRESWIIGVFRLLVGS